MELPKPGQFSVELAHVRWRLLAPQPLPRFGIVNALLAVAASQVNAVEKPPSSSSTSRRQIWKAPTAQSIVFSRVQPSLWLKNERR